MDFWYLIPLATCIAYFVLAACVRWQLDNLANMTFLYFLFVSAFWSTSAFMLTRDPSATTNYLVFWNNMVIVGVVASTVAYYQFVRSFCRQSSGILVYVGSAFAVAILVPLLFGRAVFQDTYMANGYLHHGMGPWSILLIATLTLILIAAIWTLAKAYRASADPIERNRVVYIMVGWGVLAACSGLNVNMPQLAGLSIDHLGTLANAVIIGVAISRDQLPDIRLVARRTVSYFLLLVGTLGSYVGLMMLVNTRLPDMAFPVVLGSAAVLASVLAVLFHPMKYLAEGGVDRVFHRETYAAREMLTKFSEKMASVLDIEELSDKLLFTLGKALRLTRADLLLRDTEESDFVTFFSYPKQEMWADDRIIISHDNAIVKWLFAQKRPLATATIDRVPGLRVSVQRDRDELNDPRFAVLVPIVSREKLIGIVAFGRKQAGASYRAEDFELVTTMARQAGIVIDNVRLYSQAKNKANVDELTRLFNHGYLHQRISEEIARCARFGDVFTLLCLDLDFFKCRNDVHGHAYGDKVLRKVGELIKNSIRSIDIAFRYGGDEFAVLLPQTSTERALKMAERIRSTIESHNDSECIGITCSIGIASWPTDGVTREQIVEASDSAMYNAKNAGRNRVCIASKIANNNTGKPAWIGKVDAYEPGWYPTPDPDLSTIYALAATVDAKDRYTYGHSRKVSQYAAAIAAALGYDDGRINTIRTAGLLHDIGKIGVSDQILSKPGKLNDEEWEPIRAHPTQGVSIIEHVSSLRACIPAVQYHHEHYDGSGYPSGLKGDNIPMDARIIAVADSYDAMTSSRAYRKQLTKDEAINELIRCAEIQFDPQVVSAFIKSMSLAQRTPSIQ